MNISKLLKTLRQESARAGELYSAINDSMSDDQIGEILDQVSNAEHGSLWKLAILEKAERILPEAARMIGIEMGELEQRILGVDFVSELDFEGYVTTNDAWRTFRIVINEGLTLFVHKMFKLVVSQATVVSYQGQELPPIPITLHEVAIAAYKLMNSFWKGPRPSAFMEEGVRGRRLTENQAGLVETLDQQLETFVIAHELGHVIQNVANPRPKYLEIEHSDVNESTLSAWNEEINSDAIGLLLGVRGADKPPDFVCASAELFFLVLGMLDRFGRDFWGAGFPRNSHPSADLRLDSLRGFVRSHGGDSLLFMGGSFEETVREIEKEVRCIAR